MPLTSGLPAFEDKVKPLGGIARSIVTSRQFDKVDPISLYATIIK